MLYKKFSSIVIAGGASKIISVIGVAKFLEEENMIKHIKNFVGTSAGAVLCAFIAMGYSSNEMYDFFIQNLCNDETITRMNIDEIFSFFATFGISSGCNLECFFERMIEQKVGKGYKDITFIEFAKKFGKNLVICVSNLTDEECEFWSVDTTPNNTIIKALRASCSIPLLFTPLIINDKYYLDGGMYNNFPIDYFKSNNLRDIIGINIKLRGYQKTTTFIDYVKFIGCSMMEKFSQALYKDNKDLNMISLELEDDNWFSLIDMSIIITKEKMKEYIDIGYNTVKDKMKKLYEIRIDDFDKVS